MKDNMGGDAAATESATTERNAANGEYQNSKFAVPTVNVNFRWYDITFWLMFFRV